MSLQIPTCNRTGLLQKSLEHLARTGIQRPDEILILDDGGTDNCKQVCAFLREQWGLPIQYAHHHAPGLTICCGPRNIMVKRTSCDIVVTCEPEILFVSDVLAQIEAAWDGENVVSAGTIFSQLSPEHWDLNQMERLDAWKAHGSVNAFAREWLVDAGGWDESFPGPWGWDDVDMFTRLRCMGHGERTPAEIQAIHQFHGSGRPHQQDNEDHFRAKMADGDCRPEFLVANQGREWGVLDPWD